MRDKALRWRWELFLVVVLVTVFFVNISLSEFYLGEQNFINMFQLSIEKLIVVVIMTFVIVNGEIDLSVASVMAFSACVLAALHQGAAVPFELAVAIALAAGALAGALIVREHQELVFISLSGMVQRTSVRGISRMGRPTQGVRVMNLRGDDVVSAVALVVESEAAIGADVTENGDAPTLEDDASISPNGSGNGAAS